VSITLESHQARGSLERLPRPGIPAQPTLTPTPTPAPADRVQAGTRVLLGVFVVFTLLAVNQLLVLGSRTDRFFAWSITSRPNTAFLGAAYAAGTVLSVLALRQTRWSHVRVPILTVTVFTVLTLGPTVFHRHVLHLMSDDSVARMAARVWLVIYLAVPVAGAVVVLRQNRLARVEPTLVRRPMPAPLAGVLFVQGVALAAIGAVLYAGGTRSHMTMGVQRPGWPWPVTPLTSMVLGAWLLSFGIAVVLAVRERDLSRMLVPAVAYAAFGAFEVAVLLWQRAATGTHPLWLCADVVLFATLVPVGVYGAWAARQRRTAGTRSVDEGTVRSR
jgi:hypothetical protein